MGVGAARDGVCLLTARLDCKLRGENGRGCEFEGDDVGRGVSQRITEAVDVFGCWGRYGQFCERSERATEVEGQRAQNFGMKATCIGAVAPRDVLQGVSERRGTNEAKCSEEQAMVAQGTVPRSSMVRPRASTQTYDQRE